MPPVWFSPTDFSCSSRRGVSLTRLRGLLRTLQLLDLLLHERRGGIVRSELEEALVRPDRLREVARLLRRLRQLELDVRIARGERHDPLVGLRRVRERRLGFRVRGVDRLARLRG